jgi:hypothetical protein
MVQTAVEAPSLVLPKSGEAYCQALHRAVGWKWGTFIPFQVRTPIFLLGNFVRLVRLIPAASPPLDAVPIETMEPVAR